MTLRELLENISEPCHIDKEKALDLEVEFWTIDGGGMSLLSVYANDEETKILIDIGAE